MFSSPENILTPEKAFVTLSLVNIYTLTLLPQGVSSAGQAIVSFQRLKRFMQLEEMADSGNIDANFMASKFEAQKYVY